MKFWSIQYLRAVAALMVLLLHAVAQFPASASIYSDFSIGNAGVDLFFVISGFIMFYTTSDDRMKPDTFFIRRLVRIVPLYFILTTVKMLPGLAIARTSTYVPFSFAEYLRSIFFIPFVNSHNGHIQPVIYPGWSLNFEMFFYVIFALGLFFARNRRFILCLSVLIVLSTLGMAWHFSDAILKTYTDPLILEFALGMGLGYAFSGPVPTFRQVAVFCMILTLTVAAIWFAVSGASPGGSGINFRFALWGIPAAVLVAGALALERAGRIPHIKSLVILGDASYSIYLVHELTLFALQRVELRVFHEGNIAADIIFVPIGMLISVGVAILIYFGLERPITRYLIDRLKRWRPQPDLVPTQTP